MRAGQQVIALLRFLVKKIALFHKVTVSRLIVWIGARAVNPLESV
jgi:hypothetical protein